MYIIMFFMFTLEMLFYNGAGWKIITYLSPYQELDGFMWVDGLR